MEKIILDKGFEILQDVLHNAEKCGITDPSFDPTIFAIKHNISDFEPLPYLAHLQLVYEKQPYYGRHLRFYNNAPWWYRVRFNVPDNAPDHAYIEIGASDYYTDVWLNGEKMCSHEGYFKSFGFATDALKKGEENTLLLKVDSPWDEEKYLDDSNPRCVAVVRHLIKGTYEHADSFGSRDLNPVGLWKPVEITFYNENRIEDVQVRTVLDGDTGRLTANVTFDRGTGDVIMRLYDKETGALVAEQIGEDSFLLSLGNVKKWTSYERGVPSLYRAEFSLIENGEEVQKVSKTVGFRKIEFRRDDGKAELWLNGSRFFVRGTSYLPEFIISKMNVQRCRRDLYDMMQIGVNVVRVHVHVQIPEFYELCDELGMIVMQDSDLNWTFDSSDEFLPHVLDIWEQMLTMLGHHPCIALWGAVNEPNNTQLDRYLNVLPGPQMAALAEKLTPEIPLIRGSGTIGDPNTRDSHNYTGSLAGANTHYLDGGYRSSELFNTEFGIDCPPVFENMINYPELVKKFGFTPEKYKKVSTYQYRLIKYFIEDYRIKKYNHVAGYMQFLFCDPLPQTLYGLVDFWGTPKPSYEAMRESSGKYCAILEHTTVSKALWCVNDTLETINAVLEATVSDEKGSTVFADEYKVTLTPDCSVRVTDFPYVKENCHVLLVLRRENGERLAVNHYDNPLVHPAHPEGHPFNIDFEIGMPLYRGRTN